MGNPLTNLIVSTLRQIDRDYQPGTLASMKKTKPVKWGKLLTIEREINLSVLNENPKALKKALDSYRKLIVMKGQYYGQ